VICNTLAAKTIPFTVLALARALLLVYFDIWAILNYRHRRKIEKIMVYTLDFF